MRGPLFLFPDCVLGHQLLDSLHRDYEVVYDGFDAQFLIRFIIREIRMRVDPLARAFVADADRADTIRFHPFNRFFLSGGHIYFLLFALPRRCPYDDDA